MNTAEDIERVFGTRAGEYWDKFEDVTLYHTALNAFLQPLATGASILELACGPGNVSRYLLQQRPDIQLLGTDLSDKMVELARKKNPGTPFLRLDVADLSSINKQFDGIIAGFLLPYLNLTSLKQLLQDAGTRLLQDGYLYLSAIDGDYSQSRYETTSKGDDRLFIHYYTTGMLIPLLQEYGFTSIVYTETIVTTTPHQHIIIARKKQ